MEAREVTLLAIKTFCKKAWAWLKHNWKVPFIILYTLILWLLFRRKDAAYLVLEERNNSYKKQIEVINQNHKEELEKRNKVIEKYNNLVSQLEDQYAADNKELDEAKKKEIKDIVEKHHDDPDALARMLAEKYGLNYVE
jgi:glucan phosphoethanolaminetransferase (alkaline phosphatase superfamily)